jgi:hypothetical protein
MRPSLNTLEVESLSARVGEECAMVEAAIAEEQTGETMLLVLCL